MLFFLGIIMRCWLLFKPSVLALFVLFSDTALEGERGVLGIGQAPHMVFVVMGWHWGVTVLPIVFGYSIGVIV